MASGICCLLLGTMKGEEWLHFQNWDNAGREESQIHSRQHCGVKRGVERKCFNV